MSDCEHEVLLAFIVASKAKILLSGYDNDLYREYLQDWNVEKIATTDEAGKKRIECLWANYEFTHDNSLFCGEVSNAG
jgi:DNA adenine methylase